MKRLAKRAVAAVLLWWYLPSIGYFFAGRPM